MHRSKIIVACSCVALGACVMANEEVDRAGAGLTPVHTETLGPIGIPLAQGSGIVEAGVGMYGDPALVSPATLEVQVPGSVQQVLIYWEAQNKTTVADDRIMVDGVEVVGTLVGGPTFFFGGAWSATYGADITGLGLVSSGANSLSIDGFDSTRCYDGICTANGVGMLVIYDDGLGLEDMEIRDGNDLAFIDFDPPLDTTVPQTFNFAAASQARTARLNIISTSTGERRPNVIEVTVGAQVTRYVDMLADNRGPELDAIHIDVPVPAGETSVTVQLLSERDPTSLLSSGRTPASLTWLAAGFSIEPEEELEAECRVTGGVVGHDDGNRYTAGGQAGARTALPPMPSGEWTHHQRSGPMGSFLFHGGTRSASEGTGIAWITCMDPENCHPARPAPAKQIDFAGIGEFQNLRSAALEGAGVTTDGLYWFEVNIDDLGEPGSHGAPENGCPSDGFGRNASEVLAICGCADFYRLRIHGGPTASDPVVYEVEGYLDGGNLQIHPLTGYDRR